MLQARKTSQAPHVNKSREGNTVTISAINVSQWSPVAIQYIKDNTDVVSTHDFSDDKIDNEEDLYYEETLRELQGYT